MIGGGKRTTPTLCATVSDRHSCCQVRSWFEGNSLQLRAARRLPGQRREEEQGFDERMCGDKTAILPLLADLKLIPGIVVVAGGLRAGLLSFDRSGLCAAGREANWSVRSTGTDHTRDGKRAPAGLVPMGAAVIDYGTHAVDSKRFSFNRKW